MAVIRIEAPATVANLGPGFDIFGLALELTNQVEVAVVGSQVEVAHHGPGADVLPTTGDSLTYRALAAVFDQVRRAAPTVRITQQNRIPLRRGLGSSAAAVAAGLRAGAELAGRKLGPAELFEIGLPLEGHPDNLAAALYGGFCVSVPGNGRHEIVHLDFPEEWDIVLLIPHVSIATAEARAILPARVSRADAIFNAARCALWVAAVERRELAFLRQATEDRLHQEARAALLPPLARLLEAALQGGAAGAALAGSGSAIVAFAGPHQGGGVAAALEEAARREVLPADTLITRARNRPLAASL